MRIHHTRVSHTVTPLPDGLVLVVGEPNTSMMAPRERLHRDHEGLEHDVLYSVHCVGGSQRELERISESLEFLPRQG